MKTSWFDGNACRGHELYVNMKSIINENAKKNNLYFIRVIKYVKYHQQRQSDAFSGKGHTTIYKIITLQIRLKCTVPCESIQTPWTFQILSNYY